MQLSVYFSSHIYLPSFFLFKVYEARLFRLNKGNDGGIVTSVEEAVDLQKKKSALNRFYWNLSQGDKNSSSSSMQYEDEGKKRDVGEKVMVSCATLFSSVHWYVFFVIFFFSILLQILQVCNW